MDFKRASTDAQVESRRAEILDACAALYEAAGVDGVTIKAIAERTSLSRPSVYNYYDTKEEILLALLQRECEEYTAELRGAFETNAALSREAFCHAMTDALLRHEKMLQIMSINLNAIENNVSDERLVAFKTRMTAMFGVLREGLGKFFPAAPEAERELFLYTHFSFVYGLYPITKPSEKQLAAMKKAGFLKPEPFGHLCYEGLLRLAERL
jgi:AcrR family transcriptional regulator